MIIFFRFPKTDYDTVEIKLGYSKDHRPDLKQVMLEIRVT